MLAELTSTPITSLNLGARDHAALAAGNEELHAEVFARDGHACHVCGSRCRDALEIDHQAGHRPTAASGLKAICQFCHNLRHPLWAASRHRIIPIYAPDISQAALHRLAWVALCWRDAPEAPLDMTGLHGMIEDRRVQLCKRLGFRGADGFADDKRTRLVELMTLGSAEALFEAALTVADDVRIGPERAVRTLTAVDQYLRFWPTELMPGIEDLDPAARLSRWDLGGFKVIADEVAGAVREDLSPDPAKIRSLMSLVGGD